VKLDLLLRDWPSERTLFFADEQGGSPAAEAFRIAGKPAALLTGPEGGFDDAERAAIRTHPQAQTITLGPRILRGETAALAAIALWMGIAGDW
jgi:16S rRNA (uracil1498-N3)-methyltransferase